MMHDPPIENSTPPNNRLKGLILGAQIFSVVALLGILLVFSWTARRIAVKKKDYLSKTMDKMNIQAPMDSAMSITNAPSYSLTDETLLAQINLQKTINESLYKIVENNTPDSTYNKSERIAALNQLQSESNIMCYRIENLYQSFKDTLEQIGGSEADFTSERYFVDTQRDGKLREQLLDYRSEIMQNLTGLEIGNVDDLYLSLPIDRISTSDYVVSWDWGKFSVKPSVTLNYLRQLEMEIRNFEATALNKFPQTITY